MSGVFGWLAAQPTDQLETQIKKMAQSLTHREWFQVDSSVYDELNAAYGRTAIGIFNKEAQPFERQDGRLKIWFAGELFRHNIPDYEQLWDEINDPQLALILYSQRGEKAFSQYEGSFQCSILDASTGITFIVNDRWSTHPLHYHHCSEGLFFAPEFKAILSWPGYKKMLDLDALSEYVRMQRLLGDRSFFQNISRLEYGCYLKYNHKDNSLQTIRYWNYPEDELASIEREEWLEEYKRLFYAAVKRCNRNDMDTGIYLSGGLDSRMIASAMAKQKDQVHSFTYGDPNSSDYIIANRVAKKLKTNHHNFPYENGKWVIDHYKDHLKFTEGYHNWPHLHGINTIDEARKHIQVQVNGFLGGLYTTYSRTEKSLNQLNNLDELGIQGYLYNDLVYEMAWPGLSEGEAKVVFHPDLAEDMRDRAYKTFLENYKNYAHVKPNQHRAEAMLIIENGMSLYHKFAVFYRTGFEVHCPYLDYDLVDFIFRTPAEMRLNTQYMVTKVAPEVSHIPYNKDWMPPTTKQWRRDLAVAKQKTTNIINRFRPGTINKPNPLNTDYETYLRTDLKEWAENILLDEKTLSRGIFNPDYIRSIWNRTQIGEVHTLGKLSPILSYELILREFFDK